MVGELAGGKGTPEYEEKKYQQELDQKTRKKRWGRVSADVPAACFERTEHSNREWMHSQPARQQ